MSYRVYYGTATSSNIGLIPTPTITYTSPNTTGTLRFTPVADAFGVATLTVTVNDGAASNNIVTRTFTAVVNRLQVMSPIADRTVILGAPIERVAFTVSDAETPAASLVLIANASLTFTVSGGAGDANHTFLLSIRRQTAPPSGLRIVQATP